MAKTATARKKPAIDLGTPETRAKKVLPYWKTLEPDLEIAACRIWEALRLELPRMINSSGEKQLGGNELGEYSEKEQAIVDTYKAWVNELWRYRISHKSYIKHIFFDEPIRDRMGLIDALRLYCKIAGIG